MPPRRWILLDCSQDVQAEPLELSGQELAQAAAVPLQRSGVRWRRLYGGRRDGVQMLELHTEALSLILIPTRGLGIWKAWTDQVRLQWQSPVPDGPVHPQWVPLWEPSGIGWLEGFDELLVRCGMHSMGAPVWDDQGRVLFPLHGTLANLPAQYLELMADEQGLTVLGQVSQGRLFGPKLQLHSRLFLPWNSPCFRLQDRVTNCSAQAEGMQMLYHINLGRPWLAPGAEVLVAFEQMAPRDARAAEGLQSWNRIGPPEPGFAEQVYFFHPATDPEGWGRALLCDPQRHTAMEVAFRTAGLPWFVLWKNQQPEQDGYVVGLEPATGFPNPRPFEQAQGRVVELPPGESHQMELEVRVHQSAEEVQQAAQQIQALHQQGAGVIQPQPLPQWSPS